MTKPMTKTKIQVDVLCFWGIFAAVTLIFAVSLLVLLTTHTAQAGQNGGTATDARTVVSSPIQDMINRCDAKIANHGDFELILTKSGARCRPTAGDTKSPTTTPQVTIVYLDPTTTPDTPHIEPDEPVIEHRVCDTDACEPNSKSESKAERDAYAAWKAARS